MALELTGLLAGHELGGAVDLWLDADDGSRTALTLLPEFSVRRGPIEIADATGAVVARPGDRVTAEGEMEGAGSRLQVKRIRLDVISSRPYELRLTEPQRAQAQRRAARRLLCMLAVTACAGALAALFFIHNGNSGLSATVAGVFGVGCAWTGLFIGYSRVRQRPLVYDAVDNTVRRQLRRALWSGVLPAEDARPALSATLDRQRRWRPVSVLIGGYFIARSVWGVSDARDSTTRIFWLCLAVAFAATTTIAVWQWLIARRLHKALARRER